MACDMEHGRVRSIIFFKPGKMTIEIKKSKDKQFYFVFKARNGEPLATSEMYKRKRDARVGINSILMAVVQEAWEVKDKTKSKKVAKNIRGGK